MAFQYPLTPAGWHALRAGAWHRPRRVVSRRSAINVCQSKNNARYDILSVVFLFQYDLNAIPFHYSFTKDFRACVVLMGDEVLAS